MTGVEQLRRMRENNLKDRAAHIGTYVHAPCGKAFTVWSGGGDSYLDHECEGLSVDSLTYAGRARQLARRVRADLARWRGE